MHRRCIAIILGMAILFCSIPVRIEQEGFAEEILAQITAAPADESAEPSVAANESVSEPSAVPVQDETAAPEPTAAFTAVPATEAPVETTAEPTAEATIETTLEPTAEATIEITAEPTAEAAIDITAEPTIQATSEITAAPTEAPTTIVPTVEPTAAPVYYCGLEEHIHIELCFSGSDQPICEMDEHIHVDDCLRKQTPVPSPTPTQTPESTPSLLPSDPAASTPTAEVTQQPADESATAETPSADPTPDAEPDDTAAPDGSADSPAASETVMPQSTADACAIEEHIHSDSCYDENANLVCLIEEHIHTETCFKTPDVTPEPLATEVPDTYCGFIEHVHNDLCYNNAELICGLADHTHTEACFEDLEVTPTPLPSEAPTAYLCGLETHHHSETCYDAGGELVCLQSEHEHSEICGYPPFAVAIDASADSIHAPNDALNLTLSVSGGKAPFTAVLTVSLDGTVLSEDDYTLTAEKTAVKMEYHPELPGNHQFSISAIDSLGSAAAAERYVMVEASDPVTEENWNESFAHIQLTGDLRTDILAIAQTQLGYTESETDFVFADGQQKGYTRYGAWFGSPYEDWCAMFASFILRYAGIEADFPLSGNVPEWIEALQAEGRYHPAAEYLPMPGDLIFFDWDADGSGDHVGLVSEAFSHTGEVLLELTTIEGNVDNQVAYRRYQLPENGQVLGFGQTAYNDAMQLINDVEALIAPIPPVEEVEEVLTALAGTEDETAYLMQLSELCLTAWEAYEPLGATLQSYVANGNLLMDLEWLWSMQLLDETAGGTSETPVMREDDLQTVGSSSGIKFRLFNYDAGINSNGHADVFGFRGVNKHDPEGDDTAINATLDADGYGANRARVKPVLSGGYPVFDGRGVTSDFSLGYLFGAGGNGVTAYSPANTPLLRSSSANLYQYNSARNAVDFDIANNRFLVRSYVERGDSTAAHGSGYADFMPFTYWNNTTSYTHSSGAEYYYDSDIELDYWFGMTMDTDFFQPKGGHIGQDEMVFQFSGDDDVWVFIDDVLVLDLGGTHGVVTGSINFATGEITQHLDWAGSTTPSYPTTLRDCFANAGREPNGGWSADGSTFADYSKHTFKFFYLERGAGSSNCKLSFNLPTLPDESLTVTKELAFDSPDGETGAFLENTLEYAFRVMKADADGDAAEDLYIKPGTSYTLLQDGAAIGTGSVQDDGTFLLKAGQSAQFNEMIAKGDGAVQYVVQEIMPDELTGQYGGIEYEVSGAGGDTKTEEGPTTAFTAFQTNPLSAEESQIVTYRNKVSTSNLSLLKLSKAQAAGSSFADGKRFGLQVKLGDELLPVGTTYLVESTGEVRTVAEAGVVELQIGETALVQAGILSGTTYQITEPDAEGGNFKASFSGTVHANGTDTALGSFDNAIEGSFPLNSTVHVVATNASYDFALSLPLSKQAIGNQENARFSFLVEHGVWSDGNWEPLSELPGTSISVSDDAVTNGTLTIGYPADANGDFYYKISEQQGEDGFLYDSTFYIVQVTVANREAAVTGVWRNGMESLPVDSTLAFVNQKTIAVTIDKSVTGISDVSPEEAFDFTLRVENMPSFTFPESDSYEKLDALSIRFQLSHGESIAIPCIPYGATITISETGNEGYLTLHRVHDQPEASVGSTVTLNGLSADTAVSFINQGGYMLPATGGSGSEWYTMGGLCLLAMPLLLYRKRCRKGGL